MKEKIMPKTNGQCTTNNNQDEEFDILKTPTAPSARANFEEKNPNATPGQHRYFSAMENDYLTSNRSWEAKAAFFASIKEEPFPSLDPKIIFLEQEEHGINKHIGGQKSGTRW